MIRRHPTRIELKLDDLEEYETHRKEIEQKKQKSNDNKTEIGPLLPGPQKSRLDTVHERIGYHPQPYSGLPTRLSF